MRMMVYILLDSLGYSRIACNGRIRHHLFWNKLATIVGREKTLICTKKSYTTSYYGETFQGNDFRTLLKHANKLNDPDIYSNLGFLCLVPFITTLRIMNKIVNRCFSTKKGDTLEKYVKELKTNFEIERSKTLKVPKFKQFLRATNLRGQKRK